jgi:hypothetical protein
MLLAAAAPVLARDAWPVTPPPPKPHVGFYTVHPRVGLSTYFSLSASWPHTQRPLRVVAKVHPSGETCGPDPTRDTGTALASGWLTRADHHVVWKEWTPTSSGSYIVCTWLGNPAIATGESPLVVEPSTAGATPAGTLVAAVTSKTPSGPPRAVFPTAPAHVYARFAVRGVAPGRVVTIEFRDTDGHVVISHAQSHGRALRWYSADVSRARIKARLGYWLASVSVGGRTLGRIHFLVPAYTGP